ncbi:unnamed protein product [Timema podura]|uniref:Uncharacterized protein n=1 Tax=Timema podura TaxID=61482 RepID=A0ABN7NTW7_TIMPD|nr:unnamed protein product [Timema podura]
MYPVGVLRRLLSEQCTISVDSGYIEWRLNQARTVHAWRIHIGEEEIIKLGYNRLGYSVISGVASFFQQSVDAHVERFQVLIDSDSAEEETEQVDDDDIVCPTLQESMRADETLSIFCRFRETSLTAGWPTEKYPASYIQQVPHSELEEVNPLPPYVVTCGSSPPFSGNPVWNFRVG